MSVLIFKGEPCGFFGEGGVSTSADESNEVFSVKRVEKITTGVQDDGEEGEFY